MTEKYPPISSGTLVKTTEPNLDLREQWTDEGWASRRWGVRGQVLTHHDSHGLCYDVQHEDGTVGCYDPSELEVVVELELIPKGAHITFEIAFKLNEGWTYVRKTHTGYVTNVIVDPGLLIYFDDPEFRKLFYEVRVAQAIGNMTVYVPERNIQPVQRKYISASTFSDLKELIRREFPDFIVGNPHDFMSLEETPT